MAWRSLLRAYLTNFALTRAGRREQTAYHPIAACYLVTYRCELGCSYCLENVPHRAAEGRADELDTEGAKQTLAGIRSVCDVLDISGGEPTRRTDLAELLGYARQLGFGEIMLNSNGIGLGDQPELLDHVHSVMLGIDSVREEGFVDITGGTRGQHRQQLEAMESLYRLQGERGFDLEICTVMLADHLDELEPILEWCYARDVMVSVSPHIDENLQVEKRLRADRRYRELTSRMVDDRRRGRPLLGSMSYYRGLRDLREHRCLPMANLTVSPMGEIFWPCGELQQRGPSFTEGRPYREMVDDARRRFGPLPDCRDRCHFSCRMALSTVVNHPWELASEGLHLRRYRRHGR
jgi:MoaA/NifB/PqqE/SkfB family radical SAM enzyme